MAADLAAPARDDLEVAALHDFGTCGCESCGRVAGAALVREMSAYPTLNDLLAAVAEHQEQAKPTRRTPIPRSVVRQVWDNDGWECQNCGSHRDLTVDHIVPLAKGGTNDMFNLQTLCGTCNSSKGART